VTGFAEGGVGGQGSDIRAGNAFGHFGEVYLLITPLPLSLVYWNDELRGEIEGKILGCNHLRAKS
jgi:hypothetical protein